MIVFCTKIKTLKFVTDFLARQDVKGVVAIHGKMQVCLSLCLCLSPSLVQSKYYLMLKGLFFYTSGCLISCGVLH